MKIMTTTETPNQNPSQPSWTAHGFYTQLSTPVSKTTGEVGFQLQMGATFVKNPIVPIVADVVAKAPKDLFPYGTNTLWAMGAALVAATGVYLCRLYQERVAALKPYRQVVEVYQVEERVDL